jgi:histone H3/H4
MAKKAAKGSKKSAEILVVGTKVKDVVKGAGLQSSGELIEAVSAKVHDILSAACSRASGNGRKTVRAYDL